MKLVRIATTYWTAGNLSPAQNLKHACEVADQAALDRPDILCLPELFCAEPGWKTAELVPGPTTRALAAKARKHKMYIVCPVLQKSGRNTFNSAVLLDRRGEVAGIYHKHVPTLGELELGILPGSDVPVFQTDFGKVGIAICFDLNFMDIAERLRLQGVQLIFWPSAFEGGTLLAQWARHCRAYVVSSTHGENARILDVTGQVLAEGRWHCPLVTAEVNFDRGVHHWDFTHPIVPAIRKKHGPAVKVEFHTPEGYIVLTSQKPGLSLADLEREFKLERVDDYLTRARKVRDHTALVSNPPVGE